VGKRRGRLKGVDVRAGSVRQARLEAGLSLAAVADGVVTRAAIHLIESGRSRPSQPTLELIARRTGRPVSFFLVPRRGGAGAFAESLYELELELLAGRPAAVVARAGELASSALSAWVRARLDLALGQAEVELGLSAAEGHLQDARDAFSGQGDAEMELRAEVALIGWLDARGDPRAVRMAEEALPRTRALNPPQPELEAELEGQLARSLVRAQEWARARDHYQGALGGPPPLDLDQMAERHQESARWHGAQGDGERAEHHLRAALTLRRLKRYAMLRSEMEEGLGEVLVHLGEWSGAEEWLRHSARQAEAFGFGHRVAQILLALAEIEIERGDTGAAERALAEASGAAQGAPDSGRRAMLQGRLHALRGEPGPARERFELALRQLRAEGDAEALVRCHTAYSALLEQWGDTAGALDHAKRALATARREQPD